VPRNRRQLSGKELEALRKQEQEQREAAAEAGNGAAPAGGSPGMAGGGGSNGGGDATLNAKAERSAKEAAEKALLLRLPTAGLSAHERVKRSTGASQAKRQAEKDLKEAKRAGGGSRPKARTTSVDDTSAPASHPLSLLDGADSCPPPPTPPKRELSATSYETTQPVAVRVHLAGAPKRAMWTTGSARPRNDDNAEQGADAPENNTPPGAPPDVVAQLSRDLMSSLVMPADASIVLPPVGPMRSRSPHRENDEEAKDEEAHAVPAARVAHRGASDRD